MSRGKETCRILKEIRRQIAAANDIDLLVSECQYKGDCLGTCPKCEAEVRYLEQALERRRLAGRAVSLLGISAGLLAASTGVSAAGKGTMAAVQVQQDTTVAQDTARWSWEMCGDAGFNVARRVVDEENRPLQGVTVKLVRGEFSVFETDTDDEGWLIIFICNEGDSLVLTYPGMETVREPAREGLGKVPIVMRRASTVLEAAEIVHPHPKIVRDTIVAGMLLEVDVPEDSLPVRGVVVDEEGRLLQGAEILQIEEGGDRLVDQTDEAGAFSTHVVLWRKRFKVAKPGYKAQDVKAGKDGEFRIVLKRERRAARAERED